MLRAAALNRFDFKTYDPDDYFQRQRLHRILGDLSREAQVSIWDLSIQYQLIRAIRNIGNDDALKRIDETAYTTLTKSVNLQLPWLDMESELVEGPTGTDAEYRSLFDQWKAEWGDPNDPAVQARIKQTAAWLMSEGNNGPAGQRSFL